jgi:DNA primase
MTELAVEPLAVKQDDEFRYVSMVIARLQEVQVGKQIEDVKSRLRRLSPIKDADEYRALWGDLVALEEYRKALLQQSAGVL